LDVISTPNAGERGGIGTREKDLQTNCWGKILTSRNNPEKHREIAREIKKNKQEEGGTKQMIGHARLGSREGKQFGGELFLFCASL